MCIYIYIYIYTHTIHILSWNEPASASQTSWKARRNKTRSSCRHYSTVDQSQRLLGHPSLGPPYPGSEKRLDICVRYHTRGQVSVRSIRFRHGSVFWLRYGFGLQGPTPMPDRACFQINVSVSTSSIPFRFRSEPPPFS